MQKIIAVVMIILILQSCLVKYGTDTHSSYTSMKNNTYKNESGKVDLFFEGITIDKEYEQIGFVEATGSETSTVEELLSFLKYRAFQNGADAVINVKKESIIRETGYFFDDEYDEIYSAPSFNGIAVKYINQTDSIRTMADTSFVKHVHKVHKKDNAKVERGLFWSVLIGLATIVAVMIKSSQTEH